MQKKYTILRAFTLVELIVVITILAILGTIWFLSFQGYTVSARDATRISDLNTISKSLDLFKVQEGFYPNPSNTYEVSYSWSLAWTQWTFGESTVQLVRRISSVPLDPLTKNQYTYSITNTRQEYELGAITENLMSLNILTPVQDTYANNTFFTYITGNYNKQIVTTIDSINPNRLYILWVPTLITTEITDVTVQDILTNQSFAIKWSKNLPSSYSDALPEWQTHTGAVSFNAGVILNPPLLFDWTIQDLSWSESKQIFWENIVAYYADSNLASSSAYSAIWNIVSWQEYNYVNTLIRTDTAGLSTKSVQVSTQAPSSWWNSSPWPGSCTEMSTSQLANLNSWWDMTIITDNRWSPIPPQWEIFSGTSNYNISEWCSLNEIIYGYETVPWLIDEVWLLENLTYIDFEGNSATYLSPYIGNLSNLETLYASGNNFTSIPENFENLTNLQELDLSGNTALWVLNNYFDMFTARTCQSWISNQWNTICIEWNGSTIQITVE